MANSARGHFGRRALAVGAAATPFLYLACGDAALTTRLAGDTASASAATAATGSAMSANSAGITAAGTGGASRAGVTTGAGGTGGWGGASGASGGAGSSGGAPSSSSGGSSSASGGNGGAEPDAGGGGASCVTTYLAPALAAGIHVPVCSPISWPTNPPTSGFHYPVWAAYKTYTIPIPRGFWVHDTEHGAIVITYNCSSGCDRDLAALAALLDGLPADPTCTAPVKARIVVAPDPLLDVKFAAVSWGFALKSSCFDLEALGAFITEHYGKGPEDLCTDGTDLSQPGAIPPGCGEASDAGSTSM